MKTIKQQGIAHAVFTALMIMVSVQALHTSKALAQSAMGTGDTGGGTGLVGRVLESYAKNPLTLPAYTQYVGPILRNIEFQNEEPLEVYFRIKTWYIAPVGKLPAVPPKSLGVTFSRNRDQIARQWSREIWINEDFYKAMTIQEQGETLLHEFVMQLYFLKFYKLSEVCRMMETAQLSFPTPPRFSCNIIDDAMDEMFKPEDRSPELTPEDNENIRTVTSWLKLEGHRPISAEQFVNLLRNNGFDQRIFNLHRDEKSTSGSEEINPAELSNILRAASLTRQMPDVCFDFDSNRNQPCQVQMNLSTYQFIGVDMPVLNVRIQGIDSQPQLYQFGLSSEMHLSSLSFSGRTHYYLTLLNKLQENYELGSSVQHANLIFKRISAYGQTHIQFESMIIKKGIITAVMPGESGVRCEVRTLGRGEPFERGVTLRKRGEGSFMLESALRNLPPLNMCSVPKNWMPH